MRRAPRLGLYQSIFSMGRPQPFVSGEPEDPATGYFNLKDDDGELVTAEDTTQLTDENAFFTTPHDGGR